MDPLLQTTSGNMSSNSDLFSHSGQISTRITQSAGTKIIPSAGGVRAPSFRALLRKRNIFINDTVASTKLVKRAKEIITKELSPEMNDALAQKLPVIVENLETKTE